MWQAFIVLFIACSTALFAEIEAKTTTAEFRVSYFRPSSSLLRSIYGQGGVDYQLTGTMALSSFVHETTDDTLKAVHFWWAIDYFKKKGQALGDEHYKTRFCMLPITAGLKYIHPSQTFQPYIGLGLRYFFMQTANDCEFVQKNMHKQALGYVVETGLLLALDRHVGLDLFVAYSKGKLQAPSNPQSNVKATHLELGGLNAGIGVSYAF